jgi:hypothetical protein
MADEDTYQSVNAWGIGAQKCWVPNAVEGGSFFSPQTFHDCNIPNPSDKFPCSTKSECPSNLYVRKFVQHILAALMVDHKIKWKSIEIMNGYYVVGISIVGKEWKMNVM